MRQRRYRTSLLLMVVACTFSFTAVSSTYADIIEYSLFRNGVFSQVSGSTPTIAGGYFFTARAELENLNDFDTATLVYPGLGSPLVIPLVTPTPAEKERFRFTSPLFQTQSAMDADFPFGLYSLEATNTVTNASQTVSINYAQDVYPQSVPALTTSTFLGIQGLNPSLPFTFNFTPFTTGVGPNESFVFFNITDTLLNQSVFGTSFQSAGITSLNLPANTLQTETNYSFELIFSNRIADLSTIQGGRQDQGFDYRTTGSFRTGSTVALIPEPSTMFLFGTGLVGLALQRYRKKVKS